MKKVIDNENFSNLLSLWRQISKRRKIQLFFLLIIILLSGVAEMFSLSAIFPFLIVVTNPERLLDFYLVSKVAENYQLDSNQLLYFTTGLFVVSVLFAATLRLFNSWFNLRIAAAIGSDLSCKAYYLTLNQPYELHLKRNTSEIISAISIQVKQTTLVINSSLKLVTFTFVSISLVIALLWIDFFSAFIASVVILFAYLVLSKLVAKRIYSNSLSISRLTDLQLKSIQEGLGGIREVLLDSSQKTYTEIYKKADRPLRIKIAQNQFIGLFPRYAMEAIGLMFLALLAILLNQRGATGDSEIALLGTMALGAQRLLPAIQQIYISWAEIRGNSGAVLSVLKFLEQKVPTSNLINPKLNFKFKDKFEMKDVSFRYNKTSNYILKDINLTINKGERIGIIGQTGSGKSTLSDIMMGLLQNFEGQILIDNNNLYDINQNSIQSSWKKIVAHVPQDIYLTDSSFESNIAFGVPPDKVDHQRLIQACKQAQILSFIQSIPKGFQANVGERGSQLSGGQLQRIGIARALYKEAQVLFFDEATSALDTSTEKALMNSIDHLSKELTIIIIAHRLSSLENRDRILNIKNGRINNVKLD